MSESAGHVIRSKFHHAFALSTILHAAVLGVAAKQLWSLDSQALVLTVASIPGIVPSPEAVKVDRFETIAVEVDPSRSSPVPHVPAVMAPVAPKLDENPTPAASPPAPKPASPRVESEAREVPPPAPPPTSSAVGESGAAPPATSEGRAVMPVADASSTESDVSSGASGPAEQVNDTTTKPSDLTEESEAVERAALHHAIRAAAANSGQASKPLVQSMVRVDPQEKNIDRAFARAFAWVFAVDPSFFAVAPIGRARFIVELREDGRIGDVTWPGPLPLRLKEFVQRMVRLLSANRFRLVTSGEDGSARREFELVVTQGHVAVPRSGFALERQVGDIWMLEAGETPTPGKPSHPAVADATGRELRGELSIVSRGETP